MHRYSVSQRFSRNTWSSTLLRYAVAVSTVALALVLNLLLPPLRSTPFLLFFAAIVLIASCAGRGPALLGILVSSLLLDFFFLHPINSFSMGLPQCVQLSVFALVSLWINSLVEWRRQAREERDRYFSQSLNLLAVCGFDGYFKQVNGAWEQTLGVSCEEMISRPLMEIVHPDDQPATAAEIEKLSRGLTMSSFPNRCRAVNGSYHWLLWNGTPSDDRRDFCITGHDITDRKRAEESLHARRSSWDRRAFFARVGSAFETGFAAIGTGVQGFFGLSRAVVIARASSRACSF